jgi:hypothetical protein
MNRGKPFAVILIILVQFLSPAGWIIAQEEGALQIEKGVIRPGEFFWYNLPDLQKGQTLSVYLAGTSGNLDPVVGLVDDSQSTEAIIEQIQNVTKEAVVDGRDPIIELQEAADELFLIWDDDGAEGLAAQFTYEIPVDGEYHLLVTASRTVFGDATSGNYDLLIGLDAPQIKPDTAKTTGDSIFSLDAEASSPGVAIEELIGSISANEQRDTIDLHDLRVGDTISVFVEAITGDLKPSLALLNYADKSVALNNMNGQNRSAALTYTVEDRGQGFSVQVGGCCDEESTSGDYRLLVGINAPEVVTGEAEHSDDGIIKEAIPVALGIKLQQIIEVDEQNEFFTAAASLQIEWDDPALAFSPDDCDCTFKTYTDQNFSEFLQDSGGRWPDFTLFNQQGNRWTQNRNVVVWQDGHALYFERFTTNLQVDFDFRKYPFDEEEFVIHIDSIFPEQFYYFTDLEGFSEISSDHGEDEFLIENFVTEVSSEQASTNSTISRFTFRFGGPRHMNYYIVQVFIPILLILGVLWVTFFLRDYALRIEVASANLLVFIAFSFSLADNYPRLGYITLLDVVMLFTFIISALVIVYNVYLRRLEMAGEGELANNIDNVLDWIYPISIVVFGISLYFLFF